MFYAKLNDDGTLDRYPYTLTDMIRENTGTSFPAVITDETAASFGVVPVAPAVEPAYDHTVDLSRTAQKKNGKWVEVWVSTPATPQEIADRTNDKANSVRSERNRLLADSDWTQLPDAPVDRTVWATYRQALRDIGQQPGFPWNITWPVKP